MSDPRNPALAAFFAEATPTPRRIAYVVCRRAATAPAVVADPGPLRPRFGEYLVRRGLLTRTQLLHVLMYQDRNPERRIGACVAELGFMAERDLDTWFTEFTRREVTPVDGIPVDGIPVDGNPVDGIPVVICEAEDVSAT